MASSFAELMNTHRVARAAWKLDAAAVRTEIKALKTPYTQYCPSDLDRLALAAFGPGHTVYYIGGDHGAEYKMTDMENCVPVYLGSNMAEATRALKAMAKDAI